MAEARSVEAEKTDEREQGQPGEKTGDGPAAENGAAAHGIAARRTDGRTHTEPQGYPQGYQWRMTPVHVLPVAERISSFREVAQGYLSDAEVQAEACRCLLCKHPTCISGCPNNNPIPTFLAFVQEGRILEAAVADYEKNSLAACTGRVCNWEEQCEGWCVLTANGEGVRIGAVERYIADYALRHPEEFERLRAQRAQEEATHGVSPYTLPAVSPYAAAIEAYGGAVVPGHVSQEALRVHSGAIVPGYTPEDYPPAELSLRGARVAVVGAGPAGLACADILSRAQATVEVFDAQGYAGGLLSDGIPEFVLPQEVVEREIARIRAQGVTFHFGHVLGRGLQLDDLLGRFSAVFAGVGAEVAHRLDVPGHDAHGVLTAQEFLRRAKRALQPGAAVPRPPVGRRVLVVGAGNTSMDAARTALRLGAEDVVVAYRRTRAESPSRDIEIAFAEEEGVRFEYLVNPVALLPNEEGAVRAARLVRMRLGAPDKSGRPRPEPIPGSEYEQLCDTVIFAVGYAVHGADIGHPELLRPDGTVRTHGEGGSTDLPGFFAGGDLVRGAYTVVHAIRDGRLAADAIGEYLRRRGGDLGAPARPH
jgi:glutamate synthase (NADPH/NADH) small chain